LIELAGANEILKLLKACESRVFEGLRNEINPAEKLLELLHPFVRIPLTLEFGQVLADFVKVNAITPIVRAL
jgi:hypothetical protein